MESALRELEEELGIRALPEDLTFIGTHRAGYEKEFYGRIFRDREQMNVFLYNRPVEIGDLKLQEEEVESVEWIPLGDLKDMVYERSVRSCIYQSEFDMVCAWLTEHPPGRGAVGSRRT